MRAPRDCRWRSPTLAHDARHRRCDAVGRRSRPGAERPAARRRPALSPSRAGDFKQCPLLYRFRAIDRLPETPSRAQVRGTLVHAVLERLFELPAAERVPGHGARRWSSRCGRSCCAARPELVEQLFAGADDPELAEWLESAGPLLDGLLPAGGPAPAASPQARELLVETELESGLLLRGYIDRLDVAPDRRAAGGRLQDRRGAPAGRPRRGRCSR